MKSTREAVRSLPYLLLCMCWLMSACRADGSTDAAPTPVADASSAKWDWFDIELTDVRTGEVFTMNDFAGTVVLVETMAIWCPNCAVQANEVRRLHEMLGDPADLVSVSLDVDMNEDAANLKEYVGAFGFDWRFAVAPIELARALGNLYTAQYLNPPLSPMLIIDREGIVHHLGYGAKSAESLQQSLSLFLTP